jgi:lactoylglutathione lyase
VAAKWLLSAMGLPVVVRRTRSHRRLVAYGSCPDGTPYLENVEPDQRSESMTSPRICVVQINVPDMDRALDFYTNVLGFSVESRASYPFAVVLGQESFTFLLAKCVRDASVDYPDGAQTLINIETTDLAGKLRDLRAHGVDLVHAEPQPCPPGLYAAFRDPFGNVLEYLQYTSHT